MTDDRGVLKFISRSVDQSISRSVDQSISRSVDRFRRDQASVKKKILKKSILHRIIFAAFFSFVLSACGELSLEITQGTSPVNLPDCADNSVTTGACKVPNSGFAITSDISQLLPSNIASGAMIFGILGTAIGPYSPCTEDALNTGACSVAANRYVTANAGSDITSWSNSMASTTVSGNIANGYYDGKSIAFADANLTAANIKSGTSIFGVTGSLTPAYSPCSDDALNTGQCSTAANRYVTAILGGNIAGANASKTATIPTGFYDGTKSTTMSDTNLTAANIKSGVSIFGVNGSMTPAYSSCTDDALNTGQCSTAANRYVTATGGGDIVLWLNTLGSTTVSGSIPDGYYNGKSCQFQSTNLIAANIKSGTNIFGVSGSLTPAYSACIDDDLNTSQCSTVANRYVASTLGGDITGANVSKTATIPTGFYDGTQSATMSDTNLTAANIKSGISIFGVSGSLTPTYSSCTDNALNAGQCSTATNRYVTATGGVDVTGWSNASATTTVSASIPTGFYSGTNASFTDANLVPSNIKSGTSIFGVTGTYTALYSACTDNALNTNQCSTATSRYVTSILGANIIGANASKTATIPLGYYDGTTTATMSDTNLVAANIKSGVSIFGVTGSYISAYASCTNNALNVSQCSTAANRYVLTAPASGSNITSWSNASGTTTISASIPTGLYSGSETIAFTDSNLVAGNIMAGVSVFGVTGTGILPPPPPPDFSSSMASTQLRDKTAQQISLYNETTTLAGTTYTNSSQNGYRAVPRIATDDDGYTGGSSTIVNRTSPAWGTTTCGTTQATIDDRIADCAYVFGANATWDGSVKGNAGQGQWKLVSRSGSVTSSKGREVWQDQRTKLLWSSLVATSLNWCKAVGSNNITNNPTAQTDPSGYCNSASYQNTGTGPATKAVSACFEDGENYFTTTDGSIDNLGKVGLNLSSSPAVAWRLPSLADYEQAEVNGIRFVMPDMLSGGSNEWSASVNSDFRSLAWYFYSNYGFVNNNFRLSNSRVRCVGR